MLSLAALFACAASVSCGPGVYDRDGEQSTTKLVGSGGGEIEFMGATLAIAPGSMKSDTPVPIKFTWQRAIAHEGAVSAVYGIEVPAPDTFENDPTITIPTTPDIAGESYNMIGSMVPAIGVWVPNTSTAQDPCPPSTVCGPVQSQIFKETLVVRLAIVTQCYSKQSTPCPAGQSCQEGNACQQCPDPGGCSQ